jgi:hypothetical protein
MYQKPLRVLVCGGRNYFDTLTVFKNLDFLRQSRKEGLHIISGMARGADTLAVEWANSRGATLSCFPADWEKHGKAAGFIRNQQMLDEGQPDLVVAFKGGSGTADMVRRAKAANIKVVALA